MQRFTDGTQNQNENTRREKGWNADTLKTVWHWCSLFLCVLFFSLSNQFISWHYLSFLIWICYNECYFSEFKKNVPKTVAVFWGVLSLQFISVGGKKKLIPLGPKTTHSGLLGGKVCLALGCSHILINCWGKFLQLQAVGEAVFSIYTPSFQLGNQVESSKTSGRTSVMQPTWALPSVKDYKWAEWAPSLQWSQWLKTSS